MLAKYVCNNGATVAQVINDWMLLCTGTTSLAALSASCNQGLSSITTFVPAGWESTGTSATAFSARCLVSGSATQYKHAVIRIPATTTVGAGVWEGSANGVGTGLGFDGSAQTTGIITTGSPTFWIYAEKGCILISLTAFNTGVVEFERTDPWRTEAAGHIPVATWGGSFLTATLAGTSAFSTGVNCLITNMNVNGAIVNAGAAYSTMILAGELIGSYTITPLAADGVTPTIALIPLMLASASPSPVTPMSITKRADIYFAKGATTMGDLVTTSSGNYRVIGTSGLCARES